MSNATRVPLHSDFGNFVSFRVYFGNIPYFYNNVTLDRKCAVYSEHDYKPNMNIALINDEC